MNARNVKYLASIYKDLKERRNIQGPVVCEASEDETGITKQIFWDQKTDQLRGGFAEWNLTAIRAHQTMS